MLSDLTHQFGMTCIYSILHDLEHLLLILTIFHSPELEVCFFEYDQYLDENEGPPPLVAPEDVISQACRIRLHYRPPRIEDVEDEDEDEDEDEGEGDGGDAEANREDGDGDGDDSDDGDNDRARGLRVGLAEPTQAEAPADGISIWATIGLTKASIFY